MFGPDAIEGACAGEPLRQGGVVELSDARRITRQERRFVIDQFAEFRGVLEVQKLGMTCVRFRPGLGQSNSRRNAEFHHAPERPFPTMGDQFRNPVRRNLGGPRASCRSPTRYLDLASSPPENVTRCSPVNPGSSPSERRSTAYGPNLPVENSSRMRVEQVGRLFGGERRGKYSMTRSSAFAAAKAGWSSSAMRWPQCEAGRSGRVKHTCLFWVFGECRGSAERNGRSGNLLPPLNPAPLIRRPPFSSVCAC